MFSSAYTHYEYDAVLYLFDGQLTGNDGEIEQHITSQKLIWRPDAKFDRGYITQDVIGNNKQMLAWPIETNHDRKEVKPIGVYTVQKIGNYVHLPKLQIGGEVATYSPPTPTEKLWLQLDNGIIIEGNGLSLIHI